MLLGLGLYETNHLQNVTERASVIYATIDENEICFNVAYRTEEPSGIMYSFMDPEKVIYEMFS